MCDGRKRLGEEDNEVLGRKEASGYALFVANLLFVICVYLLAFVLLPRLNLTIPAYILYVAVSILSAVFTYGCAYGLF